MVQDLLRRDGPERPAGRSSKSSAVVLLTTLNIHLLTALFSRRHKLVALQVLLQLVREHNTGNIFSITSVTAHASLTPCSAQLGSPEGMEIPHCEHETVYKP